MKMLAGHTVTYTVHTVVIQKHTVTLMVQSVVLIQCHLFIKLRLFRVKIMGVLFIAPTKTVKIDFFNELVALKRADWVSLL